MKTTFRKTVSFLGYLCVFVFANDVFAENGLYEDIKMKLANKEIKANHNYRKETIALGDMDNTKDYRYRGVKLGRTLIKRALFGKLEDEKNKTGILDNILDINAGKELKILEAINDRDYPSRDDYNQLRDVKDTSDADTITDGNALITLWDMENEIKVIMYVETTQGDFGMTDGSNVEELGVHNTTLPPMICWERNCPDCVAQESEFRCFVRGLLQVIVRAIIIGSIIILLFACVYISTKKKKCKSADIKDTVNEVVYTDDKTALINPA
ncbi:uncharacterized protein LOC132755667 [Ruditapes philippinarum]|uniref:uncharacterized protein LOC132755667 n=1 Tax=Ruditapes philippinarum TaxID=129788 RepID=UPI00295C3910|nr:uncharacterized protein LOC132755667 [Ruditapes philippinarum]